MALEGAAGFQSGTDTASVDSRANEILVENLLAATLELRHDFSKPKRLAHQRAGYWLTLTGTLAMLGRFTNAIFQLIANQGIDPSYWYIVVCALGKFLGDCGSLLVFTQVRRFISSIFHVLRISLMHKRTYVGK